MERSKKIKLVRKGLGLSLENISKRLGVSSTQISRLETGKSVVTDEMLGRYCKAFNIDSKWMLNENSDENIVFLKEYDTSIRDRVIQLRKELNMAQVSFAHFVGVPQSAINKLESNKSIPTLQTLTKIAEACNVGVDWLQLGDESKKKYPIDDKIISYLWDHEDIRKIIYQYMEEDECKKK